jgi:hypothetical protein
MDEKIILQLSFWWRVMLWLFSFGADLLIQDYDMSSSLDTHPKKLDQLIQKAFGGYNNWDAVYFLRIAENGYEYEQYNAFFPLFPLLCRIIAYGGLFSSIDQLID